MARAARRRKPQMKASELEIPFWVPGVTALAVAALILTTLLAHQPGGSSLAGGPSSGMLGNMIGAIAHWLSSLLIGWFGVGAFWPAVALLAFTWMSLRRKPFRVGAVWKIAGGALFLFSSLAFLSLWPSSGLTGGRFGFFLVNGVVALLGWWGACLLLPLVSLAGLFILFPPLLGKGLALFSALYNSGWTSVGGNSDYVLGAQSNSGLDAEPLVKAPLKEKKNGEAEDIGEEPPTPVHIVENQSRSRPPQKTPPTQAARPAREPGGPYKLPSTDFLDASPASQMGHSSGLSREELMDNAHLLEAKLRDFGVDGRVLEVSGGPVITMYEYQPAPGIKISKVAGLSDDLTMAMRAISIRVVAPLPGKAAIGIEIPNPKRSLVTFREVVESPAFQDSKSPLSLVLGVDIMGAPVVADLAKMPHLLIAGATGSGKSVGLGAMIMSILYKAGPERVRFLMIDPKCVELALYKDIPHLIYPVLSDPSEATLGLKWAVAEMDLRYKLLAEKGVRNIETYNEKIRAELKDWKPAKVQPDSDDPPVEPPRELPFLVIIIDELADLMMVAAKEVEVYITRLAQKARASGIHLILATQRPSVDVLTGIIKANMPTRISFQVSSRIDSRTILDQMGAEKLLGQGDMLFLPPGVGKLRRLHGAYVSDDEIKKATDFIREWGPPDYLEDLALPEGENDDDASGERDEKYEEAVELVRRTQKATISHVQRHLRIGYNRAARIIEDMEHEGIIGPQDGVRPRAIF